MQLDKLVLFNRDGDTRPITFNSGALNVLTGDSRTGKSSLINILGSSKPNVPFGPIQQTVAWYSCTRTSETRTCSSPAKRRPAITKATT